MPPYQRRASARRSSAATRSGGCVASVSGSRSSSARRRTSSGRRRRGASSSCRRGRSPPLGRCVAIGEEVLWTRRFLGERWTEPATPLGWSNVAPILEHFIAYPETSRRYLGGSPALQLYRFAPYVDATIFRHLLFKLPGAAPPRFLLEMLPPAEVQAWRARHAELPDVAVYRSIFAETLREERWKRFRWNPFTNWKAWADFLRHADSVLAGLTPIVTPTGALERAATMRALVREYVKVHIASLLFANIWYELAEAALHRRGRDAGPWLRPRTETWTARTNRALWRLGRGQLDETDFLAQFGHRATSSWEIMSPRWAEEPPRALATRLAEGPEPHVEVGLDPIGASVSAALRRGPRATLPPAARGPALPLRSAPVDLEAGLRVAGPRPREGHPVPRSRGARSPRRRIARCGSADRAAPRRVGAGSRATASGRRAPGLPRRAARPCERRTPRRHGDLSGRGDRAGADRARRRRHRASTARSSSSARPSPRPRRSSFARVGS